MLLVMLFQKTFFPYLIFGAILFPSLSCQAAAPVPRRSFLYSESVSVFQELNHTARLPRGPETWGWGGGAPGRLKEESKRDQKTTEGKGTRKRLFYLLHSLSCSNTWVTGSP